MLFDPFTIRSVTFSNRMLRSSIGGRSAYYDGLPSPVWRGFEERFAKSGIAGIISATIGVNARRISPLEYPSISHDRFIAPFREGVRLVQRQGCRYIMQLGDPGSHTQTSLFSEPEDAKSASAVFDLAYGYRNRSIPMSTDEIGQSVAEFADAARRVREIGCDGIEVTASKGYLIHQFLNPATNHRTDAYGGSDEKRFRFLEEIVIAVRRAVGPEFLFGVRLAAEDVNWLPLNIRWPVTRPLRDHFRGNGLEKTREHARKLEALGVDYLHVDRGFGFPHPKVNLGKLPLDELRMHYNATRHLGAKASARARLFNSLPAFVLRAILGIGWNSPPGENAAYAEALKKVVGIPVIANGGFQSRSLIDGALTSGKCDMVSLARPLLANPDLIKGFKDGQDMPARPCTFCGRCCVRTAVLPLGCYDRTRYPSDAAMEAEILRWSASPASESASQEAVP